MQPASCMQEVPLPENLRNGQKKTVEEFYQRKLVISKLPTGYGKTKTAACSYALLRGNSIANRVLYIVPRYNQATQAAGSFPASIKRDFGIETLAYQVGDNPITAQRAHLNDTAEVFVVTIQSLVASPATIKVVKEMMSKGRWFVVVDEHHHYSGVIDGDGNQTNGKWVEAVNNLNHEAMLVMSATPKRQDGKDFYGDPHVSVTYIAALKESAVKEMHLHEYEYQVDAMNSNGDVSTFTTGEMMSEIGSEDPNAIDEFMARRKMRWSPKYISPLILMPSERMATLRASGIKSQMIVQAMSCTHAEMVCSQVKALLPTLSVDWVGTGPNGRSDKDNKRIIDEFCPEEDADGNRKWTLDVLVNVGMAGEGLDSKDCTEVVVLTPGNITTSLLQLFGRGARIMQTPGGLEQPKCHINVDTDSEIAKEDKYLGRRVMALFDEDVNPEDISTPKEAQDEEREYEEIPDELLVFIADVRLVDIKMDPNYEPMVKEVVSTAKWTQSEAEDLVEKMMRESQRKRDESLNASAQEAMSKTQIDGALSKIVGLILRRMAETGMRPEKSLAGDLKRRISGKKKIAVGKSVKESNAEELKHHYSFLKNLEQAILTNHGLTGVPSWLR